MVIIDNLIARSGNVFKIDRIGDRWGSRERGPVPSPKTESFDSVCKTLHSTDSNCVIRKFWSLSGTPASMGPFAKRPHSGVARYSVSPFTVEECHHWIKHRSVGMHFSVAGSSGTQSPSGVCPSHVDSDFNVIRLPTTSLSEDDMHR